MIRIALLIGFLISMPSRADVSFEDLQTVTSTPDYLEGSFTQNKYLKVLDTGLLSNGVFAYSKNEYLHWETLQPIQNKLTLTPSEIVSHDGENDLSVMSSASNSITSVLSEILFSVLTAEWKNLSKFFELSGDINGSEWAVVLIPVDSTIEGIVIKVELSGDALLQRIVLHEKDGDYTAIEFANQRQ